MEEWNGSFHSSSGFPLGRSLVKVVYTEEGWMVGHHSHGNQRSLTKKPCPRSALAAPLRNTAGRAWLGMEKLALCSIFRCIPSSISQ